MVVVKTVAEVGIIKTDKGNSVEVEKITSATLSINGGESIDISNPEVAKQYGLEPLSNCNGLTFGDGQFVIDGAGAKQILDDEYYFVGSDTQGEPKQMGDHNVVTVTDPGFPNVDPKHSATKEPGSPTYTHKNDNLPTKKGQSINQVTNFTNHQRKRLNQRKIVILGIIIKRNLKPMKTILIVGTLIASFYFQSCITPQKIPVDKGNLKFLFVSTLDTSKNSFGQHIEIKQILPDTDELIPMTIEDRDIIKRSGYSRSDELTILKEYLFFKGDKRVSNKLYRFNAAGRMIKPEVANFSIEIEALFSFTKMLTITYSPLKPVLINRTTGEELNTNVKVVSEVYDIYIKWYKENEKTDFKNITPPLTGSPYCWLGEDKGMEPFLKKSL